jgi:hypothetical protein
MSHLINYNCPNFSIDYDRCISYNIHYCSFHISMAETAPARSWGTAAGIQMGDQWDDAAYQTHGAHLLPENGSS